jgi:hypothetical protein
MNLRLRVWLCWEKRKEEEGNFRAWDFIARVLDSASCGHVGLLVKS